MYDACSYQNKNYQNEALITETNYKSVTVKTHLINKTLLGGKLKT